MSSRFFQELREERGLVYSTYTYHTSFQETGLFTIYAGASPANLLEVLQLIRDGLDPGGRGTDSNPRSCSGPRSSSKGASCWASKTRPTG